MEGTIEDWCKLFNIHNYIIQANGSVDINQNVVIIRDLYKIPIKFGIVNGYFNCVYSKLITLENSPSKSNGFSCCNNELTSLIGYQGETENGFFYCSGNNLITLEGGPKEVNGDFLCDNNYLTSLEYGPIKVKGEYYCINNKLETLEGIPKEVGEYFDCYGNPVYDSYIRLCKIESLLNNKPQLRYKLRL
jgi:hypothetical protein